MSAFDNEQDLGFAKNVDVIRRLVSLDGKRVVDAGCGNLTFSKILAGLGAHVVAVDPDVVQAEKNRAVELSGIEFFEAGADAIPVDKASIDGVFFSYSLHHIPQAMYPSVFEEVRRVLKQGGFLYVLEPTDCPWNQVMKLFHDEDAERAAAQSAIEMFAAPYFAEFVAVTYHDFRKYESFEEFVANFVSKSFNSLYTESDVRSEAVQLAFEKHGAPDYVFQSPKKVVYLSQLGNRA